MPARLARKRLILLKIVSYTSIKVIGSLLSIVKIELVLRGLVILVVPAHATEGQGWPGAAKEKRMFDSALLG